MVLCNKVFVLISNCPEIWQNKSEENWTYLLHYRISNSVNAQREISFSENLDTKVEEKQYFTFQKKKLTRICGDSKYSPSLGCLQGLLNTVLLFSTAHNQDASSKLVMYCLFGNLIDGKFFQKSIDSTKLR